jgi:hypothetical protein
MENLCSTRNLSQDTSVGIVTGYGLDSRGSILGRSKNFSLPHRVQIGSGSHPASYPVGNGGLFLRG